MTDLLNKYKGRLRLLQLYQASKKEDLTELLINNIKDEIIEIEKQLAEQRAELI